ncbi:zinc transporter 2-like [Lucilia sericata]|uniref:zinc transporter 2-like n=1 Tax=Lucilia sericata TaxID=13632 RepID=UPI0018A84CA1|nr:zinc transporter 2-like [Lucilia sericata]
MSSSKYKNIEIQTNSNEISQINSKSLTTPMVLYGQKSPEVRTHCHYPRSEGLDVRARNKLYLASAMCLVLMSCEIIGGILSNSLAVAMDAAHLCTDFASFMIALFAIWIAGRPSTQRLNFGWYRAEVIGALLSVLLIWLLTSCLCYLAIKRIMSGTFEIDAVIMMITSGIAIFVNLIMSLILHLDIKGCNFNTKTTIVKQKYRPKLWVLKESDSFVPNICSSTEHFLCAYKNQATQTSPFLEEQPFVEVKLKQTNLTVKAAFINALGDMIQSIGVFLAGLIIYFQPSWLIVDPILTFLFAIIVFIATLGILREALLVLMESTPSYLDYNEVKQLFLSIKGVQNVHNLRIWALNLNKIACLAHLEIADNVEPLEILKQANQLIHQRYHFFETTIQIE